VSTPIDQVLAADAVVSVFQPIVDLDTGAVVAYEALARGPQGPLATPDQLFAAARAEGKLAELDEACRAAAFRGAVHLGLLDPLTVFVNVEPEVLDTAPVDDLLALADGAPRQLRIVLEITERALATRPAELLRTVERVRALGWGVALDDVGADAASLAFMPLLRPDVVKLDLRLVQDRPSPVIAEIMNAVNDYAERTGALVLAEGIETPQHLTIARALGASLGQGWLFGRPAAGPATQYPVEALRLPEPPPSREASPSPFACLPATVPLRRSPKRLLVELSKQLERQAMRLGETCVVASTFQEARHFTPATARRYRDLVARTGFVCALGEDLPVEPVPGVRGAALSPDDPIRGEWDVVVVSPHFSAALLARDLGDDGPDMDRTYEYALTYRRDTVVAAAHSLLSRVAPAIDSPLSRSAAAHPVAAAPVTTGPSPTTIVATAQDGVTDPLLHRALAASTSGITIADMTQPDQPLVFVNNAFEQLAGYRSEELLGRNCRFLQGQDTDQAAIARLRAAIAEGRECVETLLNYRGPDRTVWWNQIHMAPVLDERGRVVQYIGVQNDVTAQVAAERALEQERDRAQSYLSRIEQLAFTDPLTGLMNRRRFEDRVEVALWNASSGDDAFAVLFMDLDGFKAVNDALGHAAGDDLLVQVARRLQSRLRRSDLAARLGGDEFLVALTGLDVASAGDVAARVARELTEAIGVPYEIAGEAVQISASIGVSTFPADAGSASGLPQLLQLADSRMYAVKHGTDRE